MTKRDKVILGLRYHKAGYDEECSRCPYHDNGCEITLCNDAIALLEEQEPRVMSLEEINKRAESLNPDPVFVEWKLTGGTAWVVRTINIIAEMLNKGNRDIRVWSSRPTLDQVQNTKWEEEEDSDAE